MGCRKSAKLCDFCCDLSEALHLLDNQRHIFPPARPASKSVKMAPTKKKTKTGDTLNSRLALVMKSGKVVLGYKSTLKGTFQADGRSLSCL